MENYLDKMNDLLHPDLSYGEIKDKAQEEGKDMLFDVDVPKSIARLLVTLDCPRNCDYCVNKLPWPEDTLKVIDSVHPLLGYKEVLLTGGEPMLYPGVVLGVTRALKEQNPKQKVYLYTARYDPRFKRIMEVIDGVTYTLHENTTVEDVEDFNAAQLDIVLASAENKSNRLSLAPNITWAINIAPYIWRNIKIKRWRTIEDGALPPQENIFYLQGVIS